MKLIDSNSWNFPINRFSKDCILMRRQAFTWTTCAFPFSQWNNTGCFYCIPSHWTGSWSNKDLIMKQNATGEQNGLMDGWHGIFLFNSELPLKLYIYIYHSIIFIYIFFASFKHQATRWQLKKKERERETQVECLRMQFEPCDWKWF